MNRTIFTLLFTIAFLAISCSNEAPIVEPPYTSDASPLVVYASIKPTGKVTTRASVGTDDQWSHTEFQHGDLMGFYSSGGNWAENNGKGDFNNLKLEYIAEKKQFNDAEKGVAFSPTNMQGSKIFMYFPYCKDMNANGLVLRKEETNKVDDDDSNNSPMRNQRCVDFLSSDRIELANLDKGAALYGEFDHAFSELIILRGEGFDNPPADKWRITAVLNIACTNIRVELNDPDQEWSCTPKLVFDENNALGLTNEQARCWNAWRGKNYGITEQDEVGLPAWYVIVPTLAGARSTVEYIELYDNDGYLQRVTSLKLSGGNTKIIDPGWRYPMRISMKELVPTVNPFPITPWEGDVNLTDKRERGINNETEFANWVHDYNAYLLSDDEEKTNALLKYGDMTVDSQGGNKSWHFYVLSDLDLSKYTPLSDKEEDNNIPLILDYIIPQLNDILDGVSTTFVNGKFTNHTITGLSKTFINKMQENGSVQNFDFINPIVRNETSTSPAGIIANSMTNASVVNCNIKNGTLYNPGGPAGMVAGQMDGGMVKDCTLSGFLTAKNTATGDGAKIVGESTGAPTFSGNDADAVIPNE